MTTSLSVAALASLLPVIALQWAIRPGKAGTVYWLALFLALAGPSFVSLVHLSGSWDTGVSLSLWVTIAVSLLLFLCLSVLVRDFWRLSALLVPYLLVLGLFALAWEGVETHSALKQRSDVWLVLHVIASVVTYALCTLAAIAAFVVLLRERAIKAKRPEGPFLAQLPAVYDADRFQVNLLTLAEIVLALGILTGMAREYETSGLLIEFDHKTLLAILAFIVIGVLLVLHRFIGIRGQRAVRFVLLVYLLMTLAYPGVKFVTEVLLT